MIGKRPIFFALLLFLPFLSLSSASVWAQSGGGGGGGSGGSSGGGSSGSGGSSTGGQRSSGSQADRPRPMFLAGRVLLDDGQPPGPRTKVELVCQGSVVLQEYTSQSGTFSMEITGGQQGNRPMDASVASANYSALGSGGISGFGTAGIGGGLADTRSMDLSNCELPDSDIIVAGVCGGAGSDSTVTLTVPFDFQVLPGIAPSLGTTIDLVGASVMRNEG